LIYRRTRDRKRCTSQVLEFSKEVGEEIIKVALKLIERGSNPRLQSNMAVNQSISDVSTGLKGGIGDTSSKVL
jgi:hypothetical protein